MSKYDSWGTRELIEELEKREVKTTNDFFNCIRLHTDDIESLGFDVSGLTVQELERTAEKVGEYSMETWWMALESYCEDVLKLPKHG